VTSSDLRWPRYRWQHFNQPI